MKGINRTVLFCVLFCAFLSLAQAVPTPKGIDGKIYDLDGITLAPAGVHFEITNLNNGQIVSGTTGRYGSGKYVASLKGEDGDTIVARAFTDFNSANRTLTLSGVMHDVDILLNLSEPQQELLTLSQDIESITTQEIQTIDDQNTDQSETNTANQLSQLKTISTVIPTLAELQIIEGAKPRQSIDKITYKYITIKNVNETIELEFKVEKEWLDNYDLKEDDISLYKLEDDWNKQAVSVSFEDADSIYYLASVDSDGFFAISVNEDIQIKQSEPKTSGIKETYRIFGIFFEHPEKQVEKETEFVAENTRTSEIVIGNTGVGPNDGAYIIQLFGRKDDIVEIKIDDKVFYTPLADKNIDFTLHSKVPGITGFASRFVSSPEQISIIAIILITLIIIFINHRMQNRE